MVYLSSVYRVYEILIQHVCVCVCFFMHFQDLAAATFMAVATTTPEFFTNVISTFITESDIGLGTIIGSLMFNTLGVAAVASLAATKPVQVIQSGLDYVAMFSYSFRLNSWIGGQLHVIPFYMVRTFCCSLHLHGIIKSH